MRNSRSTFLRGFGAVSAAIAGLVILVPRASAFPIITNIVETGGDNEATDTVPAKWTGVTFVGGVANEPVPGLAAGASYTVGLFGNHAPCFVDRNHRWTNASATILVPSYLDGQEYIMSGNDNRDNNPGYLLDVSVATAVNVYMLIDNRLGGNNADPPTFGATAMQWILDEGWTPVITGANRAGNPAFPDELAVDEGADGTLNQWSSIYVKTFPAGTFQLKQPDNAGQNMYGVVVVSIAPPSTPASLVAVGGDTKVTLNWSAATGASGYVVKRSVSPGGAYTILATNATTGYVDTAVVNETTYYYVVSAINAAGESANSAEASATPKAAPGGVVAVGGTNQVAVSWNAFPGAASYSVRRSDTAGGPYSTVGSGIVGTTFTDTSSLLGGRNYYYVVIAQLSAGGDSGQSEEASALTAPSAPTNLAASIWAVSVIQLRWTFTDPVVTEFRIEDSSDGVNFLEVATVAGNLRTHLVTGQFPNETRHFRVRAVNATGFSPYSASASATTPSGGYNVNFANAVNGTPANNPAPTPPGYVQDIGEMFGDRGNGLSYGWDRDITVDGRWRMSAASPDLRYDTLTHLIKATPPAIWNLAVPNGFYKVRIVGGDATATDSIFQYDIEGVLTATVIPGGPGSVFNNWADLTVNCIVGDSQLTFTSGPSSQTLANNNKVCFIDIYPDVASPMTIGTQPTGGTIEQNRSLTLSVALSAGSQPFFYQWYRNDVAVPNSSLYTGASANSFVIPRSQPGDSGSYYVVVTNYAGTITSSVAAVTITPDNAAPVLSSVTSLDGRTISLCFSEQLDDTMGEVTDTFNYNVSAGGSPAVVGTITFRPDLQTVSLRLSDISSAITGPFSVTVQNVKDLAGNVITAGGDVANGVVAGYFAGDIGAPALAGSHFTCDGQSIEIVGGGADVWGASDQFYLVSKDATGDFDARVRVTSLRGSNAITKAVLVARESVAADSRSLHISLNPPPPGRNQVESGLRSAVGGATAGVGGAFVPAGVPNAWMRITRLGDTFSSYRGSNGVDWVLLGTTTQTFPASMVVGIGVTAHDNSLLATGSFSNFQLTGLVASPTLINPSYVGGTFSASFATQNGIAYQIQYKDALEAPNWTNLLPISGDGTVKNFTDPGAASTTGNRFYRVASP